MYNIKNFDNPDINVIKELMEDLRYSKLHAVRYLQSIKFENLMKLYTIIEKIEDENPNEYQNENIKR